jgi:hypothetical protein
MNLDTTKTVSFERSGYGTSFIQSTIFGLATFFACIGLFLDLLINQPLETWGIVLFLSGIYFIFGFVVNYFPTFIRNVCFVFNAYVLVFLYMKVEDRSDFQTSQFLFIAIFIVSISAIFWFFSRPSSKEFNQQVVALDSNLKTTLYSKLKRRMSRRKGSRAHLTTNLKLKGK